METKLIKIEDGKNKGKSIKVVKDLGSMHIKSKDLPDITDWKVGETYQLLVTVEQTGIRKADEWEVRHGDANPKDVTSTFKILDYTVPSTKSKEK